MNIYPQDLHAQLYEQLLNGRKSESTAKTSIEHLIGAHDSWFREPYRDQDSALYLKSLIDAVLKKRKRWQIGIACGAVIAALSINIPMLEFSHMQHLWDVCGMTLGSFLFLAIPFMLLANERATWARSSLRRLHRAVTIDEVAGLLNGADPLIQDYLNLLWTVSKMPKIDKMAEDNLHVAIRSIGESIAKLPEKAPQPSSVPDSVRSHKDYPEILKRDAVRLSEEAAAEPDQTIAASLRRQADTLLVRLETARPTAVHRRNAALREEIAVHIETMRISCEGYRLGGAGHGEEFTALAANIQQVAAEAGYNAAARDELDEALGPLEPSHSPSPEIEWQRLGRDS